MMNATTGMADALARRGFDVSRMRVRTPDGRSWEIDVQSRGGFRLFEIDPDERREPQEHNAVESEYWNAGDLIDYLAAVGSR